MELSCFYKNKTEQKTDKNRTQNTNKNLNNEKVPQNSSYKI